MTVKELIEILEQYKESKDQHGLELWVFLQDSSGNLNSLHKENISVDKDGDIILSVRW